ncbi:MAG: PqiC family protein [Betaproteobacteria bacterium]
MTRTLLVAAVSVVIAGCGSPPTPRFYTLSTQASANTAATAMVDRPRIRVGPVSLPESVNRPQLVTRTGATEVTIAEQHRWAGPLKDEVPRTLASDLARLTGNPQVAADPFAAAASVDYRVTVDFQRFEGVLGGDVVLEAQWTVAAFNGDIAAAGRSDVREPVGAVGYEALAAAYGRALSKVADAIAPALKGLPAAKR